MLVRETSLPGVSVFEPTVHRDTRGLFYELYREDTYRAGGIARRMVQDNISGSVKGVIRGLHFQNPRPQAKLVSALQGAIWDVAVDVRHGSPTFGKWHAETLTGENMWQLYIPEGFAHGFAVLSPFALVCYKCSDYFVPANDAGLRWDDPDLAIEWPIASPLLSTKDANAPTLREIAQERLQFRS